MRINIIVLACLLLCLVAGCGNANRQAAVASEVVDLKEQNRQCQDQLQKSKAEV